MKNNRLRNLSAIKFYFLILSTFLTGIFINLNAQTSYTFTPCGATGSVGPTQSQVNTAYLSTNLSGSVIATAGIQSFTIPSSGSYKIEGYGAAGGTQLYSPGYPGGLGAYISGVFTFSAGTVIKILVGQKGNDTQGFPADNAAPGGGGGTFVYFNASDPLPLIASGGGGGGGSASSSSIHASISTSGNPSNTGALGGVSGNGAQTNTNGASYWAGGGAGWLTDGTGGYNFTLYSYFPGSQGAGGGRSPFNGGAGGVRWNDGTDEGGDGGFGGGGGGGSDNMGTGGGGGFSGGAGANSGISVYGNYTGGGGGSYNGGTSQVNTALANSGHGKVILTRLSGVTISQTASVTCTGLSNAALTASVTGGTAPFTYTWSTGSNASSISGLAAGTYTCYARDASANTYSTVYTITQPSPVTAIVSTLSNLTCYGGTTGVIGITAGGGTSPYTYSWSPTGGSGATATGLSAGSYTCIIKDFNNCITAQIATITQPASTLTVLGFATSPVVCSGQTSILLGAGALTYAWSGGAVNGISFAPSSSAVYTVTGTDISGCTATSTVAITVNPLPSLAVTGPSVICSGNSATLSVSGAASYTWSTGSNNSTLSVSPLSTTNYNISGTSASGCVNTSVKTVSVINSVPVVVANASSSSICLGNSTTLYGSGATTYAWSGGVTDNVSFAPGISATYTVTGLNSCGSGTASISITVNALPSIGANATSTVVCAGGPVTLNGTGGVTYLWTGGVTNNSPFIPSVTNTYTVTGTDANGCQNVATKTIVVNPLPGITANATNSVVCLGNTTTLFGGGGISYSWSGGITNNVAFAPSTTANYTVTGLDANGCQNTAVKTITVINVPALTANATNPAICFGNSTTLFGAGALSYTWTGGVTNNVPFAPSATSTYTLYGSNSCGTTSNVITVTVHPLPAVSANASSSVICYGSTVTLFGGGASSYTWTGGVTNNVAFSPTVTTTYNVSGTDGNGCQNSANKTVTVLALPVVTASASSSSFCFGNSTTLFGGGATSYVWSGGVSNGVAFTPTVSTTYTVTGTDANGCQKTATKTITVNALPFVVANVSNSVICNSNSTSFYGSGANTYTWSGGITNGAILFPGVTTTYSVSGTNTLTGCTSTNLAFATVTVNPLPSLTITASSASVCVGQSVSLLASGANTYTWSGGVLNGVSFTPTANTTYIVTGKNTSTGCSNIAAQLITLNPLPVVTASASSLSICNGYSVVFTGSGANTYTWTGGVTNGTPFFPTGSSTYFVTGTNTLTGCTSTNSAGQYITVNQAPTLFITVTNSAVCEGLPTTINILGANSYTWSGGITAGVPFTPSTTSTYTVTGLNSSSGCYSTTTQMIVVNPRPVLSCIANPTAVCKGNSAVLTASGADTYTWTGGITNGVSFVPASTNNYSVSGTNTLTGCTSSTSLSQTLVVNPLPVVSSSASANSVCNGKPVTLYGLGADTYTWNQGVSDGIPFLIQQTDTFYVSGTNTLTGCTSTNVSMQIVDVHSLTPLSASTSNSLVCAGETSTLTVTGVGTHTWNTGQILNTIIISPSVTTNYTVSVLGGYGCINSVTLTQNVQDCSGLSDYDKNTALFIYPNPSSGSFTIKGGVGAELVIFNEIGQLVKTLLSKEEEIHVEGLAPGIYFIYSNQNNTSLRGKLVITQ